MSRKSNEHELRIIAGADPGFDRGGGAQIVTGLKLPFWGLSFVEFWCWGLIFGGQGGGPGPPRIRPCIAYTINHVHEIPDILTLRKSKTLSHSLHRIEDRYMIYLLAQGSFTENIS